MAITKDIVDGIKIIAGKMTEEELDGHHMAAAHDQIYFGVCLPERFTAEEFEELEGLGWFEDEDSWSIFI